MATQHATTAATATPPRYPDPPAPLIAPVSSRPPAPTPPAPAVPAPAPALLQRAHAALAAAARATSLDTWYGAFERARGLLRATPPPRELAPAFLAAEVRHTALLCAHAARTGSPPIGAPPGSARRRRF